MRSTKRILAALVTVTLLLTQLTPGAFAKKIGGDDNTTSPTISYNASYYAAVIKADVTFPSMPQTASIDDVRSAILKAAQSKAPPASLGIRNETYIAATAGDGDNPSGTNGSYTFTLLVGVNYALATLSPITISITATPYIGITNDAAVAAARDAVQSMSTIVTIAPSAKQPDKMAAVQSYVNGLMTGDAEGVTVGVTYVLNNVYRFDFVKGTHFRWGLNVTITFITVSEADTADANAVAAAFTVADSAAYANMSSAAGEAAIAAALKATAAAAVNNIDVTVTVNKAWPGYVPPTAGDAENPAGVNGRYGFYITLTKGTQSRNTGWKYIDITATPYIGVSNAEAVAAAQIAAGNAAYSNLTQQTAADEPSIMAALKAMAEKAVNDSGVTGVDVAVTSVWPGYVLPTAGNADKPNGTDGEYGFCVTVTKGTQSRNTGWKYVCITATPFTGVTNVQAVVAAKKAITDGTVNVVYNADQPAITAAVQSYVNNLLNNMSTKTDVAATVSYNSGTEKYDVALSRGSIHDSISISITATEAENPQDAADVAAAFAAIDCASYQSINQAAVTGDGINGEAVAKSAVATAADAAVKALNITDVTVTVATVWPNYIAPKAGDAANPAGEDGWYGFKVTVTKGSQSRYTGWKYIVITPTPYNGVSNAAAITAAKTAIVGGTVSVVYNAKQADKTAAVQSYVNQLMTGDAEGVLAVVSYDSDTDYDIALFKGSASGSASLTMTVTEAENPQDAADVAAAFTAIDCASYQSINQADVTGDGVNGEAVAKSAVATVADAAVEAINVTGVTVTVATVWPNYIAPKAGDAANPAGEDGWYGFKVTVTKGSQSRYTGWKYIAITATPYVTETPTITTTALPDGMLETAYSQTLTADGLTPIIWKIADGYAAPVGLTLSEGGVLSGTPASAGTFTFTVKATHDTHSDTQELTLTVNSGADRDAVNAAYDKASVAPYSNMTQAEAPGTAAISAALKTIAATAIEDKTVSISIVQRSYTAPFAGSLADPDGTNGSYTFSVHMTKGIWNRDIYPDKTIAITATAYVITDADRVAAAKAALKDGTVNVNSGATQDDKTAAVQTYVNGLLNAVSLAAGVTAEVTYSAGTDKYDIALSKGSDSNSKSLSMTVTYIGGTPTGGGTTTTSPVTTVSGTTATTTVTPIVSGSVAAATVTTSQMSDALDKAKAAVGNTGTPNVSISVSGASGVSSVSATIPHVSVQALQSGGVGALTVTSTLGSVSFNAEALQTISGASGDVTVTVAKADSSALPEAAKQAVGSHPVFSFNVTSSGSAISQFSGDVTVSVPYTLAADEDPNAVVIYYIAADGTLTTVTDARYNAATGKVIFTTTHFSTYAVGYNKVSFTDVSDTAWYESAVTFLAARGVTSGTTETTFSPDATLTRGQFITLLLRAYGITADTNLTNNFSDAGNTYYTGYLAAAKKLGITSGVGDNKFAPDAAITRQEMFTLLYNALKVLGKLPSGTSGQALSDFSDANSIVSWATDAMTTLVKAGTISGSGGKLNPTGTTTRAEMAQVLYNLLGK